MCEGAEMAVRVAEGVGRTGVKTSLCLGCVLSPLLLVMIMQVIPDISDISLKNRLVSNLDYIMELNKT